MRPASNSEDLFMRLFLEGSLLHRRCIPWPEEFFPVDRSMLTTNIYVSLHDARRACPDPKLHRRPIRRTDPFLVIPSGVELGMGFSGCCFVRPSCLLVFGT